MHLYHLSCSLGPYVPRTQTHWIPQTLCTSHLLARLTVSLTKPKLFFLRQPNRLSSMAQSSFLDLLKTFSHILKTHILLVSFFKRFPCAVLNLTRIYFCTWAEVRYCSHLTQKTNSTHSLFLSLLMENAISSTHQPLKYVWIHS